MRLREFSIIGRFMTFPPAPAAFPPAMVRAGRRPALARLATISACPATADPARRAAAAGSRPCGNGARCGESGGALYDSEHRTRRHLPSLTRAAAVRSPNGDWSRSASRALAKTNGSNASMPDTAAVQSIPRPSLRENLIIATLGVVFGDIGTSPLYAVRQSLLDYGKANASAVLGALSLIVWSLALVVTVKYVLVIMRADNRGEGGLLALTALVLRTTDPMRKRFVWIMAAGLVGAALFYGDGIITPAISVLSAVEGLKVATPLFQPYVIPITLVVLIGLFLVQRQGTAAVGGLFGPIMLLWFFILA